MIEASKLKAGMTFETADGKLIRVLEASHHKPGKGNTIMRMKLRDVRTGSTFDTSYRPEEKFEQAIIETVPRAPPQTLSPSRKTACARNKNAGRRPSRRQRLPAGRGQAHTTALPRRARQGWRDYARHGQKCRRDRRHPHEWRVPAPLRAGAPWYVHSYRQRLQRAVQIQPVRAQRIGILNVDRIPGFLAPQLKLVAHAAHHHLLVQPRALAQRRRDENAPGAVQLAFGGVAHVKALQPTDLRVKAGQFHQLLLHLLPFRQRIKQELVFQIGGQNQHAFALRLKLRAHLDRDGKPSLGVERNMVDTAKHGMGELGELWSVAQFPTLYPVSSLEKNYVINYPCLFAKSRYTCITVGRYFWHFIDAKTAGLATFSAAGAIKWGK